MGMGILFMDILKFKLYKEIYKVTNSSKTGSPDYKNVRRNTLRQIASDIICLKLDLRSFHQFSIEHFNALLAYWKQYHKAHSTIMNKIAVLKWYLANINIHLDIPKSKALGLSKKNTIRQYAVITEDLKHKIYHPIDRTVLDFQLYFGLTRYESVNLPYPSDNEIYVDSKIAHNSNSRYITAISKEQRAAIKYRQKVLDDKKCLTDILESRYILEMYGHELRAAGVDGFTDVRKFYLQQRIIFLEKLGYSEKETYQHIKEETGLKDKYHIKKVAFA